LAFNMVRSSFLQILKLFIPMGLPVRILNSFIYSTQVMMLVSARLLYQNRTSWSLADLDRRMAFKTL